MLLLGFDYLLSVTLEPVDLAEGAAFKTFGVTTRSSYHSGVIMFPRVQGLTYNLIINDFKFNLIFSR